jgi:formylglycine-generating enzyme required for sulfatase activity
MDERLHRPPRRVVRGGSWIDNPRFLRSAFRGWFAPEDRNGGPGFRVARMLNP